METKLSVLGTKPPLLETELPSSIHTKLPLLETELPSSLHTKLPLLETEPTQFEIKPLQPESKFPLLGIKPPPMETKPPLLETETAAPEKVCFIVFVGVNWGMLVWRWAHGTLRS